MSLGGWASSSLTVAIPWANHVQKPTSQLENKTKKIPRRKIESDGSPVRTTDPNITSRFLHSQSALPHGQSAVEN